MEAQAIITLLEHGGLAAVLFVLLSRVMNRLDAVTDKLISIADKQSVIIAQLSEQHRKANGSDV